MLPARRIAGLAKLLSQQVQTHQLGQFVQLLRLGGGIPAAEFLQLVGAIDLNPQLGQTELPLGVVGAHGYGGGAPLDRADGLFPHRMFGIQRLPSAADCRLDGRGAARFPPAPGCQPADHQQQNSTPGRAQPSWQPPRSAGAFGRGSVPAAVAAAPRGVRRTGRQRGGLCRDRTAKQRQQ